MYFRILGPLEVRTSRGTPVPVPEMKVRVLLADLLAHQGRPVPIDTLVADLWGDETPRNPVSALQLKVSRLRRVLDDAEPGARATVVSQPPGYLLRAEPGTTDTAVFADLTERARAADDPRSRAGLLAEALSLWRGPALADFATWEFARPVTARLEEQRLTTLELHADARLRLGEGEALVAELGDLVAQHPYREGLRALHMRALYAAGRQSEALAAYRELHARLAGELGVEPGPDVVELHRSMLRQDPALAPAPARHASNLSNPLTDLLGRGDAAAEVTTRMATERLLTLVGPGGVGKTRLAVHVARERLASYPDGVWMVELAPLGRAGASDGIGAVTTAIGTVLGLRETVAGGRPLDPVAHLAQAIDGKRMLLVLDNCEHLIDAVATVARALLTACPHLWILATSRETLGVAGETLWPVPPLGLPPVGETDPGVLLRYGAVQLFVARVAATIPGFHLDAGNAADVAVLCRRLDGIALALELAATKVRALGVKAMVERLDDRFRLLAAGHRGTSPRQQTLRGMIDWSWDLLGEPDRLVLRRLALHADGCTLEAAEATCSGGEGDVLDPLTRLVDRCMVFTSDSPAGPRYRLMESVAEYCLGRIREEDDLDAARRRYLDYYRGLAERADGHLHGADQEHWLALLDAESANLRAAHEHAVRDGLVDDALGLANALTWYWFLRGRLRDGLDRLDAALAMPGPMMTAARARAAVWRAGFAIVAGEHAEAIDAGGKALELYEGLGDPLGYARAQWFLGFVQADFGDLATSADLVRHALDDFRRCDDRWGEAAALSTLAKDGMVRGDLTALREHGERSAALFRDLGDRWGELQATDSLATLAEIRGDHERAARMHRDGLRIAERLGLWPEASSRLSWLGRIAMLRGDYSEARDLHERARLLAVEQGWKPGEVFAEMGLGITARRAGRRDDARRHLHAVLGWLPRRDYDRAHTLPLALVLPELGFLAEQDGDAAAAQALHLEALSVARHLRDDPRGAVLAVEGLAAAQALAGRHRLAARLLGSAAARRAQAPAPLSAAEQADVDRVAAAATAALGAAEFAAEHERGAPMTADDCIDLVLESRAF
ncbi:AfsR family transcriptional regulator [Actinoplanes sp. ATCC 53533]|uniref:BTAD domain-containing putative transcriptional regulator n=1 Tax=Actinoplanes sp. ATCC 53533 TaxID=1288362 RepID=UPI000F7AC3A3|nr:BTAD domain-containing putative transcriptional regulator [Actinoplanes sp. ATCC 53533]RSM47558.1 AfsR family transcriptional regulator [Actinoplanes sp. ATCC 53533]